MFGHAQDDGATSLVAMMLGPAAAAAGDYDRLVSVIQRFGDLALRRGDDAVAHILLYVETKGPPSPKHRKAIAAAADRIPLHCYAFVSPSTIARGVNMAIQLLAPARAGTVRVTHASIDDALMWFETQRPGSSAVMHMLVETARASAG